MEVRTGWLGPLAALVVLLIGLAGCGGDPDPEPDAAARAAALDPLPWSTYSDPRSVVGELVYVPIYSSAFHNVGDREHPLTATLSIHNVDLVRDLVIASVAYFDTRGKLVRTYLEDPETLGPLSTRQFVIPEQDRSGGTGANFLVKWEAETVVPRPVIEALMISTAGQQGISFTTQGVVVRELH